MQSVRVSTKPPELSEPAPRQARSFASQTLIGVPPPAVLPSKAPPPSEPPQQADPVQVDIAEGSGAAPQVAGERPSVDASTTPPDVAPAPEPEAALADPSSERDATPSPVADDQLRRSGVSRRPRRIGAALAVVALGASAFWVLRPEAAAPSHVSLEAAAPTLEPPAATAAPPEPSPAPAPAPSAAQPNTGIVVTPVADLTTVVINVLPAGAKFLRAGKEVGTSSITVELEPGEKRAFEVAHEGYGTRKVVVDGSKPEIMVGLVRKSPGGPGKNP
jgi:hypothetical protein